MALIYLTNPSEKEEQIVTTPDKEQITQPDKLLQRTVLNEESATIQIPNIGILKIVYPITKKKLNAIKKMLDVMDFDLESES